MSKVADLGDHMGYLLRVVSNAVSQEFARKLAGEDVTVAEWGMLRSLHGSDATAPTVLAEKMGMTKGAISKLAARLIDKGLIERSENDADKRAHSLSLSMAGAQKVPILAKLADGNDAAFFAVLSREEERRLRDMLHSLIDLHGLTRMPLD
ncbi:MAG: MarR family winged helix-turn-helix transcriptional regulator [Novosphingobium sp.]